MHANSTSSDGAPPGWTGRSLPPRPFAMDSPPASPAGLSQATERRQSRRARSCWPGSAGRRVDPGTVAPRSPSPSRGRDFCISRSQALPGNAMRGRRCLPSASRTFNSGRFEAEPRRRCVPRQSPGTRGATCP